MGTCFADTAFRKNEYITSIFINSRVKNIFMRFFDNKRLTLEIILNPRNVIWSTPMARGLATG